MRPQWKKIRILTVLAVLSLLAFAGYALLDHYKLDLYHNAMQLQAQMANLEKKRVSAGGVDWVYYENALQGQKPTLVMVHGFGVSKENWLDLARQLKDDFHLVLVDLPGHGESSFSASLRYDIDDQVERLHAFAHTLGLPQFHLIGNSMGGAISALYGATYGEDVASIILLNPAGIWDEKSELDNLLQYGRNPLVVENEADFAFLVKFSMEQPPFIPWPLTSAATELMKKRRAVSKLIFSHITGRHDYDFKDAITRISDPTLIVWGKQDRLLNAANASIFQRLIPESQVLLLDNVGHAPMLEIPGETAQIVRNFATHTAFATR